MKRIALCCLLATLPTCAAEPDELLDGDELADGNSRGLGAVFSTSGSLRLRVHSEGATRIEVYLYDAAVGEEVGSLPLARRADGTWSVSVSARKLRELGLASGPVFYGYRAWGPNWPWQADWRKGSSVGFISDVDSDGHRFNPNKLLTDPYARELSHDPISDAHRDGAAYVSGPDHRDKDTGRFAPKAIALRNVRDTGDGFGEKPTRAFKDEVIYEVHVRGFTMGDESVPASKRGTYAGAAEKAEYLKGLGVTAVEFLPVQETQNDQNDFTRSTDGDNYWGYMTLGYFAPDRRYAADKSPGGPTREFQDMVRAFHAKGIKVYVDVVYNHTAEGGTDPTGNITNLLSFRGLDNPTYYELAGGNRFIFDSTGTGGNFNAANPVVRDLIIDSLKYWSNSLGVDGFRFDLASVLGNTCTVDCFRFDKLDSDNALNRSVRDLPVRPARGGAGVDLIAEPWAIGDGTYQLGNFPHHWAEWNGSFRDLFRSAQNELGVAAVTPAQMASHIAGSSHLYEDDGRRPWHSVNFIVAHDGFTLRDLYAYNDKNNLQPWPFGPSDGGESHNRSWDQGGSPALQRQAARTGLALLMLSAGVPMITGGDEMYRTQHGNNNAYNLDSNKNWLDYTDANRFPAFATYAKRLLAFRNRHSSLRPAEFFTGRDRDGNGIKDITWYRDNGNEADSAYLSNASNHFLAWRLDGGDGGDRVTSIYVAYNAWSGAITAQLPAPSPGKAWHRAADTAAWHEEASNFAEAGREQRLDGASYQLHPRSLVVLVER